MNLQKAFKYTNNKHAEKEIMDALSFIIASKYLGINLRKEVKDLYNTTFIISINRLKKTLESGKIFHSNGLL